MSTSGNSSNETVPCSNTGCHFWGRANTNNYCSKCFKELDGDASTAAAALSGSGGSSIMNNKSSNSIKSDSSSSRPRSSSKSSSSHRSSLRRSSSSSKTSDTLVAAAAAAVTEAKSDSSSAAEVDVATAAGGADEGDEVPTKAVQKNKKRCWECKKKVGYTGIECRCGFIYCGTHRYPDSHKCEFDYKEYGRGVLAKNNEKLENEKLGDRL